MRLVRLKLRGAIGISKGLGLDEVEIDFSKFNSGLIVMEGENGKGKTTIIENLHPYRRLVSREGNLADHFYLKDSYRKLEFVYNGMNYSSEIYIDGCTKKIEAYLRENGFPLNDGKATTYDEVVEKIFGSPDLFFSSVFSAQKSLGLSELPASQKRELFYELLNLTRYEKLHEKTKYFLRQCELNRERLLEKIENCKTDISQLAVTEFNLSLAVNKTSGIKAELGKTDEDLNLFSRNKQQRESKLSELDLLVRKNEIIEKKILQYSNEIESIRNELKLQMIQLENEKDKSLKELSLEDASLELIRQEKESLEDEKLKIVGNLKIEIIETELSQLKAEARVTADKIHELKATLKDEEIIRQAFIQKSELKEVLEQCNKEEYELTSKKLLLEENKKLEMEALTPLYQDLLKAKENLSNNKSSQALEKANKERLIEEYERRLSQIEEDAKIISLVPCSSELGGKCNFLSRAYKSQSELEVVKRDYQNNLDGLNTKEALLTGEVAFVEKEINDLVTQVTASEQNINSKYFREFGALSAKLDKLKIVRSSNQYELEKLARTYPESILARFENAKNELILLEQKSENNEKLIASKRLLINETKENKNTQILAIDEKIKLLNFREDETITKLMSAKDNMIKMYEQKIKSVSDQMALKQLHFENLIDTERKEICSSAYDEIAKSKLALEDVNRAYLLCQKKKDELYRELVETETFIEILTGEIKKINTKKVELELLNKEYEKMQSDIKDFSTLAKAFDKTGIPILKLENSSVMITSLANELLASFDNKFRITFETTKLTKDRKKMKEVFDINVLDVDGICELKNKSGGERVWIETSIQLALGILLRSQGKVHETSFLDEQDGALDAGNALSYRAMIERAHEKSGVHNTIIITHRSELVELIDQKIIFDESCIRQVA